jgi:ELWxxDGT repeat protein
MKRKANIFKTLVLLLMGLLINYSIMAQKPEIVEDLNTVPFSMNPRNMKVVDGTLYLSGFTNSRGFQLFTYDGVEGEGFFFRNGYGDQNWAPTDFVKYGEDIYFRSGDEGGSELRKFDGETVTTIDIYPGFDSSIPLYMIEFNENLYFSAIDEDAGRELWEYDGENLTLFDINVGAGASDPEGLMIYNDELVFVADDGTNGRELWAYDGESLTMHDINEGAADGITGSVDVNKLITEYNSVLYFVGNDGSGGELWAYDGEGVYNVADELELAEVGRSPQYLTVYNGALHFYGLVGGFGTELCYFDGITAGVAANIAEGASSSYPKYLTVAGDYLYFEGQVSNGRELYVYDGEEAVEYDLNPGANHSYPYYFTAVGSRLYFIADDGTNGEELWMHDGTSATLIDINEGSSDSDPRYLTAFGNSLFCKAQAVVEGSTVNTLWEHDGSSLSINNITGQTLDSYPYDFAEFQGKIFFSAEASVQVGTELYTFDENGIELFDDILEGSGSSSPTAMTVFGDEMVFFAESEAGNQFYAYDGNSYTTYDVLGERPMLEYEGNIYFRGYDEENGTELWVYDGSSVSMVQNINAEGNSYPDELFVHDGILYFSADDGINGRELWKYDGTTAVMVDNLYSEGSASPRYLVSYDGDLYFRARSDADGTELFYYDGTTVNVINIGDGSASSNPAGLKVYDGKLLFRAARSDVGNEMWAWDGETLNYYDLNEGPDGSTPVGFTEFNDQLYFGANDGINGNELWQYDGTTASLVEDFISGEEGLGVGAMIPFGNMLYMSTYVDQGYQTHRFNGSEIEFVDDIFFGGEGGDAPSVEIDDYLYFAAGSEQYGGSELWRIRKTSEENDILTFNITNQDGESTINTTNHTVTVEMPFGTDLSNLTPALTISDYAEVSPGSGVSQDFSEGAITYSVTAEFGNTQDWAVTVVEGTASTETDILTFALDAQTGAATIDATNHTVSIEVATSADITSLTPTVTLSVGAVISPSGAQDFTSAVTYTVTAQDGSTTQDWVVTVTQEEVPLSVGDQLQQVTIYPNPASSTVKVNGLHMEARAQLIDLSGAVLFDTMIEPGALISVENFKSGLYFLKISDEAKNTTTKLLIGK